MTHTGDSHCEEFAKRTTRQSLLKNSGSFDVTLSPRVFCIDSGRNSQGFGHAYSARNGIHADRIYTNPDLMMSENESSQNRSAGGIFGSNKLARATDIADSIVVCAFRGFILYIVV